LVEDLSLAGLFKLFIGLSGIYSGIPGLFDFSLTSYPHFPMLPPIEAISRHFPYEIALAERSLPDCHFPDSGSTAIARGVAVHPAMAAESNVNAADLRIKGEKA